MKFGGTSVKDFPAMKNIANIIKCNSHTKKIIVISAIAQGTNMLAEIGKLSSFGKYDNAKLVIEKFISRHIEIASQIISKENQKKLLSEIEKGKNKLLKISYGISLLNELTPKTLDLLYSFGETFSSLCVSFILEDIGLKNLWIDATKIIITDSNHNFASPNLNIVEKKLKRVFSKNKKTNVFVTQGFIGASENGAITTMGRESSDFSAAVFGCSISAKEIQIWTDVDGIFTADPTVVKNAKLISEISFDEAFHLTESGAKVLHSKTMIPAKEKNIPIRVLNSKNLKSKGSLVFNFERKEKSITGIAWQNSITMINFIFSDKENYHLNFEILNTILGENKTIPLYVFHNTQNTTLIIKNSFFNNNFLVELSRYGKIKLFENKSIISIVGNNLFAEKKIISSFTKVFQNKNYF